jgi:SAM-dependent methyltransferase
LAQRVCLSIGAGPNRGLPPHYRDFDVITLDVDAATHPDVVADVRDLSCLQEESFDAVYMAHLLEHFHRWEVGTVLGQVQRVLRTGGLVEIRVPHVRAVFEAVLEGHDVDEALYESAMGPISALDILFGHGTSVERGNSFMAHRTAFTPSFLERALRAAGLRVELCQPTGGKRFELCGIARKVAEDAGLEAIAAEQPLHATPR